MRFSTYGQMVHFTESMTGFLPLDYLFDLEEILIKMSPDRGDLNIFKNKGTEFLKLMESYNKILIKGLNEKLRPYIISMYFEQLLNFTKSSTFSSKNMAKKIERSQIKNPFVCIGCGGMSPSYSCLVCESHGYTDCEFCDGGWDLCGHCEGDWENAEACEVCGGEGNLPCGYCDDGYYQCNECDGEGGWPCEYCNGDTTIPCRDCIGTGCDVCDGEGQIICDDCNLGWMKCHVCEEEGNHECGDCWGEGIQECNECLGAGTNNCSWCDEGMERCEECGGSGSFNCENCLGLGKAICGSKHPLEVKPNINFNKETSPLNYLEIDFKNPLLITNPYNFKIEEFHNLKLLPDVGRYWKFCIVYNGWIITFVLDINLISNIIKNKSLINPYPSQLKIYEFSPYNLNHVFSKSADYFYYIYLNNKHPFMNWEKMPWENKN